LCTDIFESQEITIDYLLPYLKRLVFDKVVNVRVTLSKVISELFINGSKLIFNLEYSWVNQNEELNKIASHLENDENKNVNILWRDFKDFKKIYYSEEEQSNYNNSEFVNKMKFLNDEFGISRNLPSKSIPNLKKFSENKIFTAFDNDISKEQEEDDDDLGAKNNTYQMKNDNDKETEDAEFAGDMVDSEETDNKNEESAYTNQNENDISEQQHENASSNEEHVEAEESNENSDDKNDETNNEEVQDDEEDK